MQNSKYSPNHDIGIHMGLISWRILTPCCWLHHNANTNSLRHKQGASHYSSLGCIRSSILQKYSPAESYIVRWNRRLDWYAWFLQTNQVPHPFTGPSAYTWCEMALAFLGSGPAEQRWVQWFRIQNLRMPIFFCLNMLEIWIQTIFETKWSLRDPAVFQPFHCVSNTALQGRANTATNVIVHIQYTPFLNLIIWTWNSPVFHDISDFKFGYWSGSLSLTTSDLDCQTKVT